MTTQHKPKATTPHEVDRGGMVYLVMHEATYEGVATPAACVGCALRVGMFLCRIPSNSVAKRACQAKRDGIQRNFRPVQAVG